VDFFCDELAAVQSGMSKAESGQVKLLAPINAYVIGNCESAKFLLKIWRFSVKSDSDDGNKGKC